MPFRQDVPVSLEPPPREDNMIHDRSQAVEDGMYQLNIKALSFFHLRGEFHI